MAGTASKTPARVLDLLAENPFIAVKKAAERLSVSYTTAQRAVETLEKHNILKKVGEARRDRVFCANEILDILEEPAKLTP